MRKVFATTQLSDLEKETLALAASEARLSLSAWMRIKLLPEAEKDLIAKGKKPPTLKT